MIIGYGRVSREDQDLTRQIDALQKAGCEKLYLDKMTGTKFSRPELDRMLMAVEPGDTVVVHKLDRLGRSTIHLLSTVTHWRDQGIHFKSLSESLDTSSPHGKMIFTVMAAFAELERDMISERTRHALAVKKSNGKVLGRPVQDRAQTKSEITAMVARGLSDADIQEQLQIGRSTYYKLKKI
jgi:DNA invertase Pin-like site-specific DNA recombinase